jgi:hypothetical protein
MLTATEFSILVEIRDLLKKIAKGTPKKFNCSIGKIYPRSETKISNNNSYTEADREYLEGRELSG